MKAIDLLKEIVKFYPNVVAMARNKNGDCNVFVFQIPCELKGKWWNSNKIEKIPYPQIIEWDSENWKENIVTINDI
jgi:hypothetical protein